jgi:3-hydroxyacyl-[acyl-carrier-protein] dehydratase
MRWIWIDRFVEFQSGRAARSIKNVSLAEEHLHDHFRGFPVMPASLIIEGMAQTGGILLGEMSQFQKVVVLAKIPKVLFHGQAFPGDTLIYDVHLLDAREDGGIVECAARIGERLVAEAEIVFANLPQNGQTTTESNFSVPMEMLRVLNVAHVPQAASALQVTEPVRRAAPGREW